MLCAISAPSQTLGRWVKAELDVAGIDIGFFSAHSTCHTSTLLEANRVISVDEIRCSAGWSRFSDVFARFYNRLIIRDSSLQSMILNMQ